MPRFIAFAVNLDGVALASYMLKAEDDTAAETEAGQYLEQHRMIEIWSLDHRRVARLVRKAD